VPIAVRVATLQLDQLILTQQRDGAVGRPVDQAHQRFRAAQVAGDQAPRAGGEDRLLGSAGDHERPRRAVEQPGQHVGCRHGATEPLGRCLHPLQPARFAQDLVDLPADGGRGVAAHSGALLHQVVAVAHLLARDRVHEHHRQPGRHAFGGRQPARLADEQVGLAQQVRHLGRVPEYPVPIAGRRDELLDLPLQLGVAPAHHRRMERRAHVHRLPYHRGGVVATRCAGRDQQPRHVIRVANERGRLPS